MNSVRNHNGFSLIELMIAMVLGLVIVMGTGSFYATLKGTILTAGKLETAQENLRSVYQLVARSLHQADSVSATPQSLTVTYDNLQTGDVVLSCLGHSRSNGDQDVFTLQNNNVLCRDGNGAAQVIATHIASMAVSTLGSYGVQLTLTPQDVPTSLSSGITMQFALRQKYIKDKVTP